MILLTSTSDLIQVVSGSTSTLDVHASWVDMSGTTFTPGRLNTAITSATTTSVVTSPTSGVYRNVKFLSVQNSAGGSSETVTVQHTDGTTVIPLFAITLPAGYTLVYQDGGDGWTLYDASGNIETSQQATGRYLGTTLLTTSGTFTTQNQTHSIRIRGVGGGGGGSGCTSVASAASAGGGGGAGSYAEKIFAVSPSTGYTYTCGSAGTGNSGAAGGGGGTSTFIVGGTTVTCNGGSGAVVATAVTTAGTCYAGAAGGAVSTNGTVNCTGAPGGPGVMTAVTPLGASGCGGSSPFGGGGAGITAAGNGNAGGGYGAGGGGALTGASTARTGGAGTAGCWVVDEFS